MYLRKLLFAAACTLLLPLYVCAQQTKEVKGHKEYIVPSIMGNDEAQSIVLKEAQKEAIADAFGIAVSEGGTNVISIIDGKTSETYYSTQSSKFQGYWIKTTDGPSYEWEINRETGQRKVTCRVEGIVRERTSLVDISAKIVLNGETEGRENDVFRNGDKVNLLFTSPSDGYLAVYLYAPDTESVFCLLPSVFEKSGIVQIEHGHQYVFFSKDSAISEAEKDIYPLELKCEDADVVNIFYIIFSPNRFTKAKDEPLPDHSDNLRYTDFESFNKWLSDKWIGDSQMQVLEKRVTIKAKKFNN